MSKSENKNMIENESGTKFINTHNLNDFSTTEALHSPLLNTSQVQTLLLNLNSGQSSPLCKMSVSVLYFVIEGEGELIVEDEHYDLRAGSMAIVPSETNRIISAAAPMRVVGIQVL
jgi:quercetin dioxygenase-like cupin family protein